MPKRRSNLSEVFASVEVGPHLAPDRVIVRITSVLIQVAVQSNYGEGLITQKSCSQKKKSRLNSIKRLSKWLVLKLNCRAGVTASKLVFLTFCQRID